MFSLKDASISHIYDILFLKDTLRFARLQIYLSIFEMKRDTIIKTFNLFIFLGSSLK